MKHHNFKIAFILSVAASLSASYISCATTSQAKALSQPEQEEVHIPTPLELYQGKTRDISISVESAPKATTKGKAFSSPYSVKVSRNEEIIKDFSVTVIYPSAKADGKISFSEKILVTDDSGIASFTPDLPSFSCETKLCFYPTRDSDDEEVIKEAQKHAVTSDYIVQTDLKNAGGLIALVDFNQKGLPVTSNPVSSSTLLMNLMKNGFTKVGNIDLTNYVLKNDVQSLKAEAKRLTGNASAYLVFGTVKYADVQKADSLTTYTLIGELKCLDLRSGTLSVNETFTVSATDKNDWTALTQARQKLSERFAHSIRYGI